MYIPEKKEQIASEQFSMNGVVQAHLQFTDYVKTISVIKQMSLLCRAIQKHRGLSMSVLAGYQQFSNDLASLQQQVNRRMALLQVFTQDLIEANEFNRIEESWQTIANNWQQDDVLVNFELHSFFLKQLFDLTMSLAKTLLLPFVGNVVSPEKNNELLGLHSRLHYFSVIDFCCKQMPAFTEVLAKLRGLGTYVVNQDVDNDLVKSKVAYFLQNARNQHEILYSAIEQYANISHHIPSLPADLAENEEKLKRLFHVLEGCVSGNDLLVLDSRALFDMASEIIDVYWQVVDQGLTVMTQWQEESIELWAIQGQSL